MFRGILPKRAATPEFTMVTPGDSFPNGGKENNPAKQPRSNRAVSVSKEKLEELGMDQAFNEMLDNLQIPSTLRPKLSNMDSAVKAAMLKSSQVLTFNPAVSALPSAPRTPKTIRKSQSSDSLVSPKRSANATNPAQIIGKCEFKTVGNAGGLQFPAFHATFHSRGMSLDADRSVSQPNITKAKDQSRVKGTKDKDNVMSKANSPSKIFATLSGTSSTVLEIETVKKLRLLLRNESASWTEEFIQLGGYTALMTRLNEILEVEWREEQHDDQILHELLRCFKALSTSSIGCIALRSCCPDPFAQLMSLLYSDKKPGDIATRQLIVELLLILLDLYLPSSLPSSSAITDSYMERDCNTPSTCEPPINFIYFPAPHLNVFSLIRDLLLTPAPPPSERPSTPISPHAFIESLHKPRIYKTYLSELSDVCRDFFWVFCHANNTIWALGNVDETKVEKPRAPGGMTGGVEFEAMAYMHMHFKLLNAIAKATEDLDLPKEDELSAHKFHSDLFLSGIERVILVARKASTTYYPTLHLELARYLGFAIRAKYELPWSVSRLVGLPPPAMCKQGKGAQNDSPKAKPPASPNRYAQRQMAGEKSLGITRKTMAPTLPSPKKVEPIKFN